MKIPLRNLVLLSLPLAIASCDNPAYQSNARAEVRTEANSAPKVISTPAPQPTPTPIPYSFDKFGEVINRIRNQGRIEETRAYDFDGDEDLDIIVRTTYDQIFIYENKIPQHNQRQTSATAESYK
ncbi:MAG: hypothetical protein WC584_01870 [Candidatus Pacearchaeota archaeon]